MPVQPRFVTAAYWLIAERMRRRPATISLSGRVKEPGSIPIPNIEIE